MVIILGNYIDFDIKTTRGLPAFNPAGSNRMFRLAQSFKSVGEDVIILSPACAMTMNWMGRLFHKKQIKIFQNIEIHYCSAFGMPVVGMFFEQINVLYSIWKLSRFYRLKAIVVYCYYPSSVWASLFAKYILRITIIEDLEDVCVPNISDWKSTTEANPIQQLIGSFLMKIMLLIADGIIIPTANFLPFIKNRKIVEIVSGCIAVPAVNDIKILELNSARIRVLFSGALENENGIPIFLDFLRQLDNDRDLASKFVFDISGHGSKEMLLKEELEKLLNIESVFYGFLTEQEYSKILKESSIALVLQNPLGRYGSLKTPSKGYEYMSNAKTIIVSDIGDFGTLPEDVIILLKEYNGEALYGIFQSITFEKIVSISTKAYDFARSNWDTQAVGVNLKKMIN